MTVNENELFFGHLVAATEACLEGTASPFIAQDDDQELASMIASIMDPDKLQQLLLVARENFISRYQAVNICEAVADKAFIKEFCDPSLSPEVIAYRLLETNRSIRSFSLANGIGKGNEQTIWQQ